MAAPTKNYFSRIGKNTFSLILVLCFSIASQAQVTHQVTVQNFSFSPTNLVINQGDIVEWVNVSGFHNVNGTTATFPANTNNFGNNPANSPWTYEFTFNNPGANIYRCDVHPMMQGIITVTALDCPELDGNIGDPCQLEITLPHIGEINENCECEITSFYCEEIELWTGTPCDDGNPNTENDVVTDDCECTGSPIYCPDLEANVGDTCDDDDETTENDLVTPDCICMGTSIYDCPALQLNIGDSCDDGNADTENDTVNADCECVGTFIFDCPDLQGDIGDSCDPDISLDCLGVITEDCACEITTCYCEDIGAWPGTPCDDDDPNTENDVVTEDCECLGTPIFCPDLDAFAGDTCDDGNETTVNDVITPDCNCIGTSIYDCPELQLNFGDPCNDENPDTENDVIQEDCSCLGEIISPENDLPCDAISLSCGQTLTTSSSFASQSMEPINCVGETPEPLRDVWFGISMAGQEFNYLVETTGIDAVIGLYSGGCATLNYEFCDSQSLYIPAENTGDFLIRVYAIDDGDDFSISLACETVGVNDLLEESLVMQQFGESIRMMRPEKVHSVIIYDLIGKRVQEDSGIQEFSLLESLNSGIYLAVAYDHSGAAVQTLKIFKR